MDASSMMFYYLGLIIFSLNGLVYLAQRSQAASIQRDVKRARAIIAALKVKRRMYPLRRK